MGPSAQRDAEAPFFQHALSRYLNPSQPLRRRSRAMKLPGSAYPCLAGGQSLKAEILGAMGAMGAMGAVGAVGAVGADGELLALLPHLTASESISGLAAGQAPCSERHSMKPQPHSL